MRSNYNVNETIMFQVLSRDQCEELHYGALEVLADVGVLVHDEKACEIFTKGGAFVDGKHVRIPASMVEKAIWSAPSRIVLCDRNGHRRLALQGNNFYFGCGPTTTYTIDLYTRERRYPEKKDTVNGARVMDALDNIDFLMDFGTIRDVPEKVADIHLLVALLENSTKPIIHWGYTVDNYKKMVDICTVIAGSVEELQRNPFLCLYAEPSTPLQHSQDAIQKLIFMAEMNLPAIYTPGPMMGTTAPATPAGTIVVALAESLSGLVLSQLVQEGTPYIMGGVLSLMDMQTTILSYGAPEFNLMEAALTNMAQYYQLPMFSTAGCTDAKEVDEQAAIEATISCFTAALSGANLIHDVGYTEYGSTSNLAQLVMCDEIIGMVKRMVQGIPVNQETMALHVIKEVGPGGQFLTHPHTLNNYRENMWFPQLMNRQGFEAWVKEGRPRLGKRAMEKARTLVENHRPEELSSVIKTRIHEIVHQ